MHNPSFGEARQRPPRPRLISRSGTLVLLLGVLFALTLQAGPSAFAASLAPLSPSLTPAQAARLRQRLKKQIHVTPTGHQHTSASPTQAATPMIISPSSTVTLPASNNIGITDVNTRASGNFDGSTRSYPAQALQDVGLVPGISFTSQNITFLWPAVAAGQPDNYQAAGQVIPVTATPGAATVGFLGAATVGPSTGTFTLTYTDGTTSTVSLSFTDWWNGIVQANNQVAVQISTLNTSNGSISGTFDLYTVTASLNTSKTLQSVTLPSSTNQGWIHVFAVGVSGPTFNNIGISDDGSPASANFDVGGCSYSAEALASVNLVPNQPFDLDGIAYSWPAAAAGSVDNDQASGQVLPVVPVPNATMLGLLGAASHGPSTGTATMTFTDGTTQTFTLTLTDWAQTAANGNLTAATMSYRNCATGKQTLTVSVFAAETAIPAGKTLQSVTLPGSVSSGQLHVFAVGTRATLNNLGTSNNNQPGEGNYDGNGRSWSIQALEAENLQPGQPFTYNGASFTWPASYGTLADNMQAAGQTIPVPPVPNATTLAFVGSGTNGSPSGTATITYTDGSTSTFTLGLTDWGNGTPQYSSDQIMASFTTINIPGGTRSGNYYLYYSETPLTAGKTLQSVTLPTTVSTGQMHIFAVGTRSAYTNIGISDDSAPATASFDTFPGDHSYSEESFTNAMGWNPGDTLTYQGINYVWPDVAAGQGDNFAAPGQVVPVTAVSGATTIGFVGAAADAGTTGYSGTATLTYTNGSTLAFTLGFSDWTLGGGRATPLAGNRLFALLPYRNTRSSGQQTINTYLFETEVPLASGKTLQSVTLPASASTGKGTLHVFMIGTRAGENYPNNVGSSDDGDSLFANYDQGGKSYSVEALEGASGTALYPGQSVTTNGVTFTWPASYSVIPDNYQAAGQVIAVTPVAGATTLAFLGSATNAGTTGSSGTVTLTYTDGNTSTFTLSFADWCASSTAGATVVATTSYRNTPTGQQSLSCYVFYTSVSLASGKTLQSVTLPSSVTSGTQLHVFAIGTK